MLEITVPATEGWDERREQFVKLQKEQKLTLEHSLVSISKWEAKWQKSYFAKVPKTEEELLDYIKCMTITQNVSPSVYDCLSVNNMKQISDYMDSPMTATRINDRQKSNIRNNSELTSELLYYAMIAYNIPMECQKWHINRLITLIRICEIKNRKQDKPSRNELLKEHAALNAKNRKKYNSNG